MGCHGIPQRCLSWRGKKMSICARCLGERVGHVLALGLFIAKALPAWWVGALMVVPMALDGGAQLWMKMPSTNVRRFWTGLLGGMGVGVLVWWAVGGIWALICGSK